MSINTGSSDITDIKVGSTDVNIVTLGTTVIWKRFSLNSTGLISRLVADESGNFADGVSGTRTSDADRVTGPFSSTTTSYLGYGLTSSTSADCARKTPVSLGANSSYTIMWWSKIEPATNISSYRMATAAVTSGSNIYGHGIAPGSTGSGEYLNVDIYSGGPASAQRRSWKPSSNPGDLRDGEWHHYSLAITGGENLNNYYFDGSPISATLAGNPGSGTSVNMNGDRHVINSDNVRTADGYVAWGDFADFRIYSRVLSVGEIQDIANGHS